MDMKEADRPVDFEVIWQVGADPVMKMNKILTCYIIYHHNSLVWIDSRSSECLQECKVDVFLLFTFE